MRIFSQVWKAITQKKAKTVPPVSPPQAPVSREAIRSVVNAARPAAMSGKPATTVKQTMAERPVPVPPPAAAGVSDALAKLNAIQQALGRGNDMVVRIPCRAILANLPVDLRGSQWREDAFPDAMVFLPRETVVSQLRTGRVVFLLSRLIPQLPPEWVAQGAEAEIEFDLATVVEAIPPEHLHAGVGPKEEWKALADMGDYFSPVAPPKKAVAPVTPPPTPAPVEPVRPAPPVVAPAPPPAPTPAPAASMTARVPMPSPVKPPLTLAKPQEPPQVSVESAPSVKAESPPPPPIAEISAPVSEPPPSPPPPVSMPKVSPAAALATAASTESTGWDGVEHGRDASIQCVDINTASLEELQKLPNVGRSMAKAILDMRAQRGRFNHIFELTEVPGIGRKMFFSITGLDASQRTDRHEALNNLLGLPKNARPTLQEMVDCMARCFHATGCVLTSSEGMSLAETGFSREDAEHYAANVPALFHRAHRYLRRISKGSTPCVAIPDEQQSLMLLDLGAFYLILRLPTGAGFDAVVKRADVLRTELAWLLEPRAIVRGDVDVARADRHG